MKINKSDIEKIKLLFHSLESKQDLLELLNQAKPIIYSNNSVSPYELKQITWYSNPRVCKNRYNYFSIKKKDGTERSIHAPVNGLKSIQKTLAFILQCVFEPSNNANAFLPGRSIVTNAKSHVGMRYVYNIDLKDFFHSIEQARFWRCLQLPPFNLNNDIDIKEYKRESINTDEISLTTPDNDTLYYRIKNGELVFITDKGDYQSYKKRVCKGIPKPRKNSSSKKKELFYSLRLKHYNRLCHKAIVDELRPLLIKEDNVNNLNNSLIKKGVIANIIASLCFEELEVERKNDKGEWNTCKKNVLPQGAPTSPIITNIICKRLDHLLNAVANRFGLKYTRYADDITFSSMHNVYQNDSVFINEIRRIIKEQGFHIKETKTRLQKDGYRKEVTGLLVNEKVNVQKRYIKQLRMWIYFWERYGYEKASEYFFLQYITDKGNVMKGNPDMANVISGKLEYLKMVKGDNNNLYLNLKKRYDDLTGKIEDVVTNNSETNFTSQLNDSLLELSDNQYDSRDAYLEQKEIIQEYPLVHDPQIMVKALRFFTENDKDLKYSTHSWEEGKYNNYDEYMSKIRSEWKKINRLLQNRNYRLYSKISSFLFNNLLGTKDEDGKLISWGDKRLNFGWSSPELKKHMEESGHSPFSCPIPDYIRSLDQNHNLFYFKDYAEVFKNEIEFREDSNNFKKIILDLWENVLGYNYFNIIGLEKLVGFSFFTDIQLIKEVLTSIFTDMFKKKESFNEIVIEKISNFKKDDSYHLIRITQKDSFVTRPTEDPKLTNPTGDLDLIIKNLTNLADYSIVSRFEDGEIYRLNYLVTNQVPFKEKIPNYDGALGFTHEFKFYL